MKNKFFFNWNVWSALFMFSYLFVLTGCKEESTSLYEAYDPNMPVAITDFIPKTGGVGQRMVIYGENFGNDTSIVRVNIGGREAIVIGVNNKAIYCFVPGKAYSGKVGVRIGSNENLKEATASETFDYQRKMVVSTLAGYKDERGNYETKDGPFGDCGGFANPSYMAFDPIEKHLLYVAQDGGDIRLLNFKDSLVTTPITRAMGNWTRFRTISFTPDGGHMIIANDQTDINGIATSILSRAKNFKDPQLLTSYQGCNGAAIHPIDGEMYFNSYQKGQFLRYDLNKYLSTGLTSKDFTMLFSIQDNNWEFNIAIHPMGDYAYILINNRHYILRTDYNWEKKQFMQPYLICGTPSSPAWVDGVGANARLSAPWQGVFVKNSDYEGKADEYDFYFTDRNNQCIRKLTPEGKVTTFAGRGSSSVDTNPYGHIDGDLRLEARFYAPMGLAYDEANKTFYVGDIENRCIRKISLEE